MPLPVLPPRVSGPDWMVRGHSFAHDTRCAAVGNLLMSSPISARIDLRGVLPDAGDLVEAIDAPSSAGSDRAVSVDGRSGSGAPSGRGLDGLVRRACGRRAVRRDRRG